MADGINLERRRRRSFVHVHVRWGSLVSFLIWRTERRVVNTKCEIGLCFFDETEKDEEEDDDRKLGF
jgi:hypothetical protein